MGYFCSPEEQNKTGCRRKARRTGRAGVHPCVLCQRGRGRVEYESVVFLHSCDGNDLVVLLALQDNG